MADDPRLLRGIDWKSAFPFTLIFRSFRVAIHPSKLVLALMALVLIYFGGRILGSIWPSSARAVPHEMTLYVLFRAPPASPATFLEAPGKQGKQLVRD